MRNVTIWTYGDEDKAFPSYVRMFVYKGNKRTLNEFLYPTYIHRGIQLAPRNTEHSGIAPFFDLDKKDQVVLMGYTSSDAGVSGEHGCPLVVLNSYQQAINWLIKNGYEFHAEESATRRAPKIKAVDRAAEQMEFINIARTYETSQVQNKVVVTAACEAKVKSPIWEQPGFDPGKTESPGLVSTSENEVVGTKQCPTPPVPPTPPASRVLNDMDAPVIEHTCSKRSWFSRLLKWLSGE